MIFFYLYLFQLLIRPQDFYPAFLGWPVAWMTILPGIIYGIYKNPSFFKSNRLPYIYLMTGFLAVVFVSTMISAGISEAGLQFNLFLKRITAFFMVYLLLSDDLKIRNGLFVYMVMSALLGIHSTLQIATGVGFGGVQPLLHYDPPRAVWCGVWDGSNSFGVLFVTSLPICMEFISRIYPFYFRLMAGICMPFILLGLYFVDSRGDTLSALVMIIVYSIIKFSKKTNIVLLVVGIILLGSLMPSRMTELSTSESSAHERTWLWEQGIRLLKENPLLGVGSGQFISNTESSLIAHSNHVSVFSELGLLGFFVYISLLWFTFKGLILVLLPRMKFGFIKRLLPSSFLVQSVHRPESQLQESLARILFCSMIGFCIATLFIVLLTDLHFLILGFSAAVVGTFTSKNKTSLHYKIQDVGGIIGVMFCVILMYYYFAHFS